MESNISRDHIALEAMKVMLKETTVNNTPFWQRIARWFGKGTYNCIDFHTPVKIAKIAYMYADAMMKERGMKED